MKKLLFALGFLFLLPTANAQDISRYTPGSDEGVVYFLPKTALDVNIIATKVTYQPGDFCQYANRYMRMNDINPNAETYWEIKQIDVRSVGIPDSTNAYRMKVKDKNNISNIELTKDGLIKAINTQAPKEEPLKEYALEKISAHENARKYMTEDILMAGSTAKMAELTAREIYNIRESKNLILRGQADTMPKDGASLKLIIDNLDKQERALTELFTGRKDREDKVFSFRIIPNDEMKDHIVFRFSRSLGILSAQDLSGEPVYLTLKSTLKQPATSQEDAKKKEKLKGAIYNIPGKGMVSISYNGKEFFKGELPITQFGNTEVLVDGLFDKKVNTRVIFNPQTGSVVKIDKD